MEMVEATRWVFNNVIVGLDEVETDRTPRTCNYQRLDKDLHPKELCGTGLYFIIRGITISRFGPWLIDDIVGCNPFHNGDPPHTVVKTRFDGDNFLVTYRTYTHLKVLIGN